jgi:hypothetical protein
MALCLDALLRMAVQRRPWALTIACGWLGILISVHYTAVAFVLVLPLAAWYARDVLRPGHFVAAALVGLLPLLPFLVYEVNPSTRFQDVAQLLTLSRGNTMFDFETVSSTIQVGSTLGAAGLGGHAGTEIAAQLGRWNNLSLLGPILAAAGLVIGVVVWPRGAIGRIIAAWTLAPIVAYLRHGAPIIFHYMFIEFVGLAMCVGVLGGWAFQSRSTWLRSGVAAAIGVCALASAMSVLVLLNGLDMFDLSTGYGIPVGYSRAAGEAARAYVPPGGVVLVGDNPHAAEVLRFGVGYGVTSRSFEDCLTVPYAADAVYLLASEQTPGAKALEASGAPLLARIPRPGGDAYRVYGALPDGSTAPTVPSSSGNQVCDDRVVWDNSQ